MAVVLFAGGLRPRGKLDGKGRARSKTRWNHNGINFPVRSLNMNRLACRDTIR
jgi:hypothetical protein